MPDYILMHYDEPVFLAEFKDGQCIQIRTVFDIDRVPLGCLNIVNQPDVLQFMDFWLRRTIPVTRENISDIQDVYIGLNPAMLAMKSLGVSYSDCYWLRPVGSDLQYSDVHRVVRGNTKLARIFLSCPWQFRVFKPKLDKPVATVAGNVPKIWHGENLLKSSIGQFGQEPYNESLASRLLAVMGADHVTYDVTNFHGVVCSRCPNVLDDGQEFISAHDILKFLRQERFGGWDDVKFYVDFAESHGVSNIRQVLDCQIELDYLMRNIDRNWVNFGLVRDAASLKFVKSMPVFDTGNSMFYNSLVSLTLPGRSGLTGLVLYDDLKYVSDFTDGMREAAEIFPELVQVCFKKSSLRESRKAVLTEFAAVQSDRLLHYFGKK